MANSNVLIEPKTGGGRWIKSRLSPGLGTPAIEPLVVASGYATKLFPGDVLARVNDGTVKYCPGNEATAGAPSHLMVSAKQYLDPGDSIVKKGAYLPSSASLTYSGTAATSNPQASVVLGIPLLYQIVEFSFNAAAATVAAAHQAIGDGFDIYWAAGATTNGGYSNVTMDLSTLSTSEGQFILRAIPNYCLNGTANNPLVTGWKGWFEVNASEVDELL